MGGNASGGRSIVTSTFESEIERIKKHLLERFGPNLIGLILYGSWAKGIAKEDSDIDLLAVFERLDTETRKALLEIERGAEGRNITILPASPEEFDRERVPVYTAVKMEGKILYGELDLSVSPEPPARKYEDFFRKSGDFESRKVRIAEELLGKEMVSGVIDLCFVASKHTIQAALAMKGQGYSSKVAVLLPLAESYFGREISEAFRALFALYIKFEYGMESASADEARVAISYANKILSLYSSDLGA